MNFLSQKKLLKPKKKYLKNFLNEYWFAPQDVLLRSVEANIWEKCNLMPPILDIGTGDGGISRLFFSNTKIDVGIDLDENGIKEAKKTGVYKKVLCANAEKMPFADSSFNTVISNSTFEHIENDIKAVVEVSRVLKKNGYFFLTVPSQFLPKIILLMEGGETNSKAKRMLKDFNTRVSHFHYRPVPQWEALLKKHNLKLAYHRCYFPKHTTRVWYRLFKISVTRFKKRELWSYLAHSRFNRFIPKNLVIYFLSQYVLNNAYQEGLSEEENQGAMLFLVSQKLF